MYEGKPEFIPGGGCKTKKPSMGGVWIFSGGIKCCLTIALSTCFSTGEETVQLHTVVSESSYLNVYNIHTLLVN